MRVPAAIPVDDRSRVAEARRLVTAVAGQLEFPEAEQEKIAIIVTEMGTNLVKHGGGGEIIVRVLEEMAPPGIEILAIDRGKGIWDVGAAMRDGYSTAGSPGDGLGAIRRLSAFFDLYSLPGRGTCILSRSWGGHHPDPLGFRSLEMGVICLPKPGEELCGDAWGVEVRGERSLLLVADGLGHGAGASEASELAIRIFRKHHHRSPAEILGVIHEGLTSTRGVVAAVAEIDDHAGTLVYAGVGNISASIIADGTRSLISHNGTIGHEIRFIREYSCPFPDNAVLVMHTDGLSNRARPDAYPGLAGHHPSILAALLYRDNDRKGDDVTVLVAARKWRGTSCHEPRSVDARS